MRLLLDEMYPARLAADLRDRGIDVVAVLEVPDLVGRPDPDVLAWATRETRVTVTENVRDFAAMAADATAGLLMVNAVRWPRTRPGQARLADALDAWASTAAPGAAGVVGWL